MKFWSIVNQDDKDPEIRIEGTITMEPGFWEWLMGKKDRSMTAIEKEIQKLDGRNITVWINSYGGEVYAASLIYTALKEHKGKVTVKISGTAISAASVIAMAGDEVLMSPTAIMMIHNPLISVEGQAKDLLKAVDILNEVKETIMNAYVIKTKLSRAEISKLMDEETWMSVAKAKKNGFIDGTLYEDEESDVQNIASARKVYNAMSIQSVDLDRLRQALEEQETSESDDDRPDTGGSFLPENEPDDGEEQAEDAPNDVGNAGMPYAQYTYALKKAEMEGVPK